MILLINTTTEKTAIGLAKNGKLIAHKIWTSHQNQSQELLPEIDKLFSKTKTNPRRLKAILANIGPGSFTGLRVGLSIANSFGFALNLPVIGISRFELVPTTSRDKKITVQILARADEYYTAQVKNFKLVRKPYIAKKIKGSTTLSSNKLNELKALLSQGQKRIKKKEGFVPLLPLYVRPPHITKPRRRG